jgi:ankyrin repeat protein
LQIMYLEQEDDITKEKDEFTSPLQTLLRKKKYNPFNTLLQKEDTNINLPDKHGMTALHVACVLDLPDCVKSLLVKSADINAKDNEGKTALHRACEGSLDCVNQMLDAGANLEEKDNMGQTPLHIAAGSNRNEIINSLLQRGAKINAQDNDGLFVCLFV